MNKSWGTLYIHLIGLPNSPAEFCRFFAPPNKTILAVPLDNKIVSKAVDRLKISDYCICREYSLPDPYTIVLWGTKLQESLNALNSVSKHS